MAKVIVIEKCSQCPHNDHRGGFGVIKYIPVCRLANREQPYEVAPSGRFSQVAHQTVDIPDWCPLEDR